MNFNLLSVTQALKKTRWSVWYIKIIIVRDSEKLSIGGRVRPIKCLHNGFNRVRLMSIWVIESQNTFYSNSLFTEFTKIYSLEFWFKHMMVIRKIDILIVQLVKGNFAARKYYHLRLSTRKFIILNFQLGKSNWKLVRKNFKPSTHKTQFPTRKIIFLNLQFVRSNSQLAKRN